MTQALASFAIDTVRFIRLSEFNRLTVSLDTYRKVIRRDTVKADTRRSLIARVQFVADTFRKAVGGVQVLLDTLRILGKRRMHHAPDYVIDELADRYLGAELDERLASAEIPEKYEYMEDGTEMKEFILGEQKEVGVELSTTDGTNFWIESAPYVYKDSAGTVLGSGEDTIDGAKVYVLLAPSVAGYSHKVVFTITTQPLDANGQLDINRNKEVIKATVAVNVTE